MMGGGSGRLRYLWRVLRTGLGFLVFGGLCLSLSHAVLPIRLRRASELPRDIRAQHTIHAVLAWYVGFLERIGILHFATVDAELLGTPGRRLIVANHPTLLDYVFLTALVPQLDSVVNSERADHPVLGGCVRASRYVRNDSGGEIVSECAQRLRAGRNVLIFPEGTRSPVVGLREFHRGAARIALEAECDLQPVLISCDPPTLRKGQKWYDVPEHAFRLGVRVLEPVRSGPILESLRLGECSRGVAARRLTAEIHESLSKGLAGSDVGNA